MVVWLEIESWVIGKGGAKREGHKGVGWSGWGKWCRVAGFCGPCVCWGLFLML
jgi:hypothetical protein